MQLSVREPVFAVLALRRQRQAAEHYDKLTIAFVGDQE